MASSDYLPLIEAARKKVIAISREERRQIQALYLEVSKDFSSQLKGKSQKSLTYRWLKDYAKALKKDSKTLFQRQSDVILEGITDSSAITSEVQRRFFSSLAPQLSQRFTDVLSKVNQDAVNELVSGKIYHNFAGLSTRIWNYKGEFDRDIGSVIEQGIIAKKSAYDLAKDLELYLNPEAKKPWEWQKVYPNVNKVVDYNAQRLARTSCTHAYQLSLERSTHENPFVEEYQWLSSNSHSRICDLCAERNGQYYKKGRVPLDHPNGMCTIIPVIRKSYDEIGRELADWANGGKNEGLDRWLKPHPSSGIINKTAARSAIRNTGRALTYNPNADFSITVPGYSVEINRGLSEASRKVADLSGADRKEHMYLVNLKSGTLDYTEDGDDDSVGGNAFFTFINLHKDESYSFVHSHTTDGYFSETDMRTLLSGNNINMFIATRIDGVRYVAEKVKQPPHMMFDVLYMDKLEPINEKSRKGLISAPDRTRLREEIIVENLLKDYTKGLIEFD